jgi:hypothetical protein
LFHTWGVANMICIVVIHQETMHLTLHIPFHEDDVPDGNDP